MRRFAERRLADVAAVEDVVSNTYMVAVRRRHELPAEPAEVLKWLFVVARWTVINEWRRVQRQDRLVQKLRHAPTGAQVPASAPVDERVILLRAWRALRPTDRRVLMLWLESGNSAELASRAGVSVEAAKVRLLRARRRLEAEIDA